MSPTEFARMVAGAGMYINGRATQACRRVLVDGETAYAAAKAVGVDHAAVSRALKLLRESKPVAKCPKCGSAVKG